MTQELVSIIMPTYNCGHFIEKSIHTVQAQSYQNWELIVVDDCSNDETIGIVSDMRAKDERINIYSNASNSGAAVSRNLALRNAKGRWIAFLDSDDLWVPTKLEKQIKFMVENRYAFTYHEYIEIELTETTTDVLFRDLKRVVCGLQEQGIWTAVDDFGIGYSSLNLIRDIPWNVLKVDKSFVPKNNEDQDNISNKMFKHVIMLAHDIGLECVIEGVESIDQLEVLRQNNCNIAQGYFFDRPLPLEDFEERIDRKIYPGY